MKGKINGSHNALDLQIYCTTKILTFQAPLLFRLYSDAIYTEATCTPPKKNNLPDNRHVETQILMVQLETTLAHLCLKTAKHNKWVKLKPIVRAIASPPVCTFSAEHPFVRCTFLNKQCY